MTDPSLFDQLRDVEGDVDHVGPLVNADRELLDLTGGAS